MPAVKPKVFAGTPSHTHNKSALPWEWLSLREHVPLMCNYSIAMQLQELQGHACPLWFSAFPRKSRDRVTFQKKNTPQENLTMLWLYIKD